MFSWAIKVVEYDIGFSTWPKLQFNQSGQPAIAYYSSSQNGIRFASRTAAGDWIKSTVVSGLNGDASCSFKFGPDGRPALSYSNSNTVNFASPFKGAIPWVTVQVAAGDPQHVVESSLALDPLHFQPGISAALGTPGLRFFQEGANITTWIGFAADTTPVAGYGNSLDFDPFGQPCIAYHDASSNLIKTAHFNGSSWEILNVGPGDGWCSLVFGTQPALTYLKLGSPSTIFLATAQVPLHAWTVQTPIAEPADSPSLAIPPGGGIGISYHAIGGASIKYTVWTGASWLTYEVERTGKDHTGHFIGDFTLTSLAFNPITGQPAIAYYERTNGAIRYAEGTETQINR